jgi:hypothetical protein
VAGVRISTGAKDLSPRCADRLCGQACSPGGGLQGVVLPPLQMWMLPNVNSQYIEDKRAHRPAKNTCDTLPHPRVASVDPPWLETAHFKKCMHM